VRPVAELVFLRLFGVNIRVLCHDRALRDLVIANFSQMRTDIAASDLEYEITGTLSSQSILRRADRLPTTSDDSEFLYAFEKDLTIQLQKFRSDLYFLHAAVIGLHGKGILLVAQSGGGKSTTTWGLLHHGFDYLSDELAPVDLKTMTVLPYPRALCLKDQPPGDYPLPHPTFETSTTLHVPTEAIPSLVGEQPMPIGGIFFLQYQPTALRPAIQPVGRAEAVARIFANSLNPLAHRGEGIDAAAEIALNCACLQLSSTRLSDTCKLLKGYLAEQPQLATETFRTPALNSRRDPLEPQLSGEFLD
jgi:hypothetical protein